MPRPATRSALFFGAAVVGCSAIAVQLTYMRELLAVYAGNELVLGTVLGTWLLLTGAGAWLGRHADRTRNLATVLILGHLFLAAAPAATLVALRTGWHLFFVRGASVGPTATAVSCFLILLPYCLASGYLFSAYSAAMAARRGDDSVGTVYIADGIGSMAGGVLFGILLIPYLDHYALLAAQGGLNTALAAVLAWKHRSRAVLAASAVMGGVLFWSTVIVDVDLLSLSARYPDQRLIFAGSSPYGSVVVTEMGGQVTVFENGVPLFASRDREALEEAIHFAMVQRPDARRVLLISGGLGGAALEVLQYPSARVDYVELDPLILDVARRVDPAGLDAPRVAVVSGDGRYYIRRTGERYDVIVSRAPDPTTCQANRFFTLEFFTMVRDALEPGGVFAFGLGHYENYLSDELASMIATVYRTLRDVFPEVVMIPGRRIHFLASTAPLHLDIADRIAHLGLTLEALTPGYLKEVLDPERRADLERAVGESGRLNTDLDPVLYFLHLRYWMSQFSDHPRLLALALVVAMGVYLWRLRAVAFGVFSAGVAGSGLEVVVLLVFQTYYGSMYERLGLLVTTFMAGMVLGAWAIRRSPAVSGAGPLVRMALAIAVAAAALPVLFHAVPTLDRGREWGQLVLASALFLVAALVGGQFVLATRASRGRAAVVAATTYSADLAGACIGAFLVSGVLIPLLGVTTVCLVIAGLNVLAAWFILAWGRT